jgi:hypothetical protein
MPQDPPLHRYIWLHSQPWNSELVPGFGRIQRRIKVRSMVALEFAPVRRRGGRRGWRATLRSGCAVMPLIRI